MTFDDWYTSQVKYVNPQDIYPWMSEAWDAGVAANKEAMKECRHCGWLCMPNPDESRNWYPLEQTEQPNTQLMEGYRIGLAEMREKCAKVCEEIEQDRWNLYKGRPPYTGSESGRADPHEQGVSMGAGECIAAIRAINFEGDTGFRPVSEMIAERADGEQWSPDDMAYRPSGLSTEQAEQEPVAERKAQVNELIKESARLIASTSDEGDRYLTAVDTLRNAYRLGLKDAASHPVLTKDEK